MVGVDGVVGLGVVALAASGSRVHPPASSSGISSIGMKRHLRMRLTMGKRSAGAAFLGLNPPGVGEPAAPCPTCRPTCP